jgi:hypothetical protein
MQRTLRAALGKSRWRADWVKWTLCLLLQTATLNDRCEVVRTLIKLGADLEIKDAQVGVSQIGLSSSIQHTHTPGALHTQVRAGIAAERATA